MWQYNYDYLCHKANYKYIDKYRDKRGNWVYIYNEPETGKRKQFSGVPTSQKQKMVDANRRGAEAAEKARGMSYGNNSGVKVTTKLPNGKQLVERGAVIKGNKIRFSNATPRDLSDYDKAERTKQALKNATDKAARRQKEYEANAAKRQKQYEANAKGAEAAEKARGENYKLQRENKNKKTTRNNVDSPAISEEYLQELHNNTRTKDEYEGAQSKDLNNSAKAERTKQALKKATLNTKMSSLSNSDKTDIMRRATGDKRLSSSDANKLFSQFKKELINNLVDPSAASTEYLQELYSNTRKNRF